ncbi:MAG: methyltransferase domain-containing protein [Sciscionella sp.]|nr:methyltransferase domain-containing protein [Sciscionella sp.]
MTEFDWNPDSYLELMAEEIADYAGLQAALVHATRPVDPRNVLDLGCGSGETAVRVLDAHPGAALTAIDANQRMLAAAEHALAARRVGARLLNQRLQDPLPSGPFDLVVSALAVHHLPGKEKADLFRRVAAILSPGGRFVLADLVVPADPADAFTEIDWVDDVPSSAAEQLAWLSEAGLLANVVWTHRDLAVLVATNEAST